MRSIPFGKLLVAFAGYVLLCMPRAVSAYPSYSVNDITVSEGNTGTTTATFTVTRTETVAATVTYQTHITIGATEGTACGGNVDYIRTSGTLSFSLNERSKTINVPICPDYTPEQDETIILLVGKNMAKCTILNDDSPMVSVRDSSRSDPDYGSLDMVFEVWLNRSPGSGQTVTVWYDVRSVTDPGNIPGWARENDTATAGTSCGGSADYVSVYQRTVQFSTGETRKYVYVPICRDTTPEQNETFSIILTRAEGAIISDNEGRGTILNDD